MIATIALAIGLTFAASTLIILSLVLTAPRDPQEQTPFTQAIIDQVKR